MPPSRSNCADPGAALGRDSFRAAVMAVSSTSTESGMECLKVDSPGIASVGVREAHLACETLPDRRAARAVVADVVAERPESTSFRGSRRPASFDRERPGWRRRASGTGFGPRGAVRGRGSERREPAGRVYTYELRARRAAAAAPFCERERSGNVRRRPVEADAGAKAQPVAGRLGAVGQLLDSERSDRLGGRHGVPRRTFALPPAAVRAGQPQPGRTALDIVNADDLIVQGSLCVGFDCVLNESFGFDTIRLKENNTRIKFEDTSVGGFPTTNGSSRRTTSASGGAEQVLDRGHHGRQGPVHGRGRRAHQFALRGITGRVGFRTQRPVLDVHLNDEQHARP